MASGASHYREAERLLTYAAEATSYGSEEERYALDVAQVHATLALAAASSPLSGQGPDYRDWGDTLGITTTSTFASPNPNKEN